MITSVPLPPNMPVPLQAPGAPTPTEAGSGAALSFEALLSNRESASDVAAQVRPGSIAPNDPQRLADLDAAPAAVPFLQGGMFGSAVAARDFSTAGEAQSTIQASLAALPARPAPQTLHMTGPMQLREQPEPPAIAETGNAPAVDAVAERSAPAVTLDARPEAGHRVNRSAPHRPSVVEPAGMETRRDFAANVPAATLPIPAQASTSEVPLPLSVPGEAVAMSPATSARQDIVALSAGPNVTTSTRSFGMPKAPVASWAASADPVSQPTRRPASAQQYRTTADASSQAVSVTVHADGADVQIVARLGALSRAEFLRIGGQLLTKGGLSVSGITLDGRRLGHPSRR